MDTNNQEFFEDEEVQKTPVRKKKKKISNSTGGIYNVQNFDRR